MHQSRRLTYALVGFALIPVGLAGIVLPVIPGLPILFGSAVCLAVAAGPMKTRSGLTVTERMKLEMWQGADRVLGWAKRHRRDGGASRR
jgi:uncharacterized protein YqgC (DUF456 family)